MAAPDGQTISPKYTVERAIEGRLQAIVVHGLLTVNLYDAIWGDRVSCELPEELKPRVLKAAGKRVLVTGVVRTDAAGRPRAVRVKTIQELPGRDELPQSLEGIDPDYTGGLDVGEYAKTRWSGSAT